MIPHAHMGALALVALFWQTGGSLTNVYTDRALGFAINYPDNLRPTVRDVTQIENREMGWELVLDFVASGPQPTTPLRVIAKRAKPPTYPPLNLRQLRAGCRDYSETEVGGRVAGVCVVCGRAACSWTVYVPGNPEFSILSLDREARSTSGPEDGAYPVKSMIESMRFDSTRPRQSSSLPIRTAPY
jgi:hypothetical protein